jgi:hypothetical protein
MAKETRKIKSIYLHSPITLPGSSIIGTVHILPEKHPHVSMSESERGIELTCTKNTKVKPYVGMVPYPAIQLIVYE